MENSKSQGCDPKDVALKSLFLGPRAENSDWLREQWLKVIDRWLGWRKKQFEMDGRAISEEDQQSAPFLNAIDRLDKALDTVIKELEHETTKFTPRYIGHMVSEVSLPAILGHISTILHNPNNTSQEVSRVTSRFEKEAILDLAKMIGFSVQAQGHFTSGGTLANFEAMWRARCSLDRHLSQHLAEFSKLSKKNLDDYSLLKLGPWEFAKVYLHLTGKNFLGPVVLVPDSKHYSWEKSVSLMGLGEQSFVPVGLDKNGRLDVNDLKTKMDWAVREDRPIVMIVSVAGSTEVGSVDPIGEIQDLVDAHRKSGHQIWHHVDAAYGGYFSCLLDGKELESMLNPEVARSLKMIGRVDSVTLDPHKLGYVPYACGAFIARDEAHYQTRQFSAAYLHQDNNSKWSSTLEGSRSGAGVTATWLSNRALGLNSDGYGRLLSRGIIAREKMRSTLQTQIQNVFFSGLSDLNILTFCVVESGMKLSELNEKTKQIYEKFESSPNFSISKTIFSSFTYKKVFEALAIEKNVEIDQPQLYMLRLVLMNPFLDTKESNIDYINAFVNELKSSLAL